MGMNRHVPKHKLVKDVLVKDFAESKTYRLGALLGRGGNAEVYECSRISDNSHFAVKCL